jgi:hypothetical protein
VLLAYFDETGIHAGSKATAIAGFIGTAEAFQQTEGAWLAALQSEGLEHFHYGPLEFRKKPYENVDEDRRARIKNKLATILFEASPGLRAVGASYIGVWDSTLMDTAFRARFPTPYSFCFEMLMEMLHSRAETEFGGDQIAPVFIAPVFAQQQQFGPRALELYGVFHETGSWPLMSAMVFQEPTQRPPLQMADMLLYESYQLMVRGNPLEWQNWPYLSRMWATEDTYSRCVEFLIAHNANTLKRAVARGPIPWGPGYRPTEVSWDP